MSSPSPLPHASGHFQIVLLGPFTVIRDGIPLNDDDWPRRTGALFRLLAAASGKRRAREDLIEILWPEAAPGAGSSNLRCTLHHLRRVLGRAEPPLVLSDRVWIALNPAYIWEVDLDRFRELVREAGDEIVLLERAASLYRGELLPEDRYESWAAPLRERIQQTWRDVCLRLARAYRERGATEQAERWFTRMLESDALDEEALQGLLELLPVLGQRTRALRLYQTFDHQLRQELNLEPHPRTRAMVAKLRGSEEPEPRLPGSSTGPTPLPEAPVVPTYPLSTAIPLIGRQKELRVIQALATRPDSDRPRLVLLAAEAGLGKTRMLAAIARWARQNGILTLAGGCYEHEGRLPYGPIHDALLDYAQAQPDILLRRRLDGLLAELTRILPELRDRITGIPEPLSIDGEGQRLRLFSALARVLDRLTEDRPLVLLLDDLHWTDDATLQFLHFLLRRRTHGRITVIGTYRREEVATALPLTTLEAETIVLEPLAETDIALLLAERTGQNCASSLVAFVHARSAGNPLFTLQILRLLQQEGRLIQGNDGWRVDDERPLDLPGEVREAVARRLRHLAWEERQVLMFGAVLGREFGFSQLEAMWDGEQTALLRVLDVTLDAFILVDTERGFAFRHPLLHEVVYNNLGNQQRAVLHERAALAIEALAGKRTDGNAAELAWHFTVAGRDERALPYEIAAGEQAATGQAYTEAEKHYTQAVCLARRIGDEQRERTALEKLGEILFRQGRYDDALEKLESACTILRAQGDLEGMARVTARIGTVHFYRGTWNLGVTRVRGLLSTLSRAEPSEGHAALYIALVPILAPGGDYKERLWAAEMALDMAGRLEVPHLVTSAEMWYGVVLAEMGRTRGARPVLEHAMALARDAGDLHGVAIPLTYLGKLSLDEGELQKARTYREQAVETFSRWGDPAGLAWGTSRLADIVIMLGDWKRARHLYEQAIKLFEALPGAPRHASLPFVGLGILCLREGRLQEASNLLHHGIALAERTSHLWAMKEGRSALAEMALIEDRPAVALEHLQSVPDHPATDSSESAAPSDVLARTRLAMDDVDEAESLVLQGMRQAMARHAPVDIARWLFVRGMVRTRQRRWDEASTDLEEAISLSRRLSYPYLEGCALWEYGRVLAGRGEQARSQDRIIEARDIFRRLGAQEIGERSAFDAEHLRMEERA